jgi:hypothetical protein
LQVSSEIRKRDIAGMFFKKAMELSSISENSIFIRLMKFMRSANI